MSLSLRLPGEWDSSLSTIPDACVCTALRVLTRFVTHRMDRMLAGFGFTLTEFQILVVLHESPRSALALTRRLRLHAAPVSRVLAHLRDRDMVTRASNRPLAHWSLTDSARKRLEFIDIFWEAEDSTTREMLGENFSRRVIALVDGLPKTLPPEHPGWSD
jgi:DNA-binding MarR family transcriptional regulator